MTDDQREDSIFCCTANPDHFEDNVVNGIWPRYCAEYFDWLFGGRTYLAFPVVCFTAMPPWNAEEHKNRYGYYALAIRKDRAADYGLRRMEYKDPNSEEVAQMKTRLGRQRPRTNLKDVEESLRKELPFYKTTDGTQASRKKDPITGENLAPPQRIDDNEALAFEEEDEWRYTPSELENQWQVGRWDYGPDPSRSKPFTLKSGRLTPNIGLDLKALSQGSQSARLSIKDEDVVALFVPAEVVADFQRREKLQHLKSKIRAWPQKV